LKTGHERCCPVGRECEAEGAFSALQTLAEHYAALAESEEARRRTETIVSDFRHEKYGAKSEKLTPDQYNLPLEDVEGAQGVLDAAQEKGRGRDQGQIPRPLLFWQPQSWSAARACAARGTGGRAKPKSIVCPCGCGEIAKIGEAVSQCLDVIGAL
jgi:hypothetical protein